MGDEFDNLLFLDFFKKYRKILFKKNHTDVLSGDYKIIVDQSNLFPNKKICIKKRDPRRNVIIRIATVSHTAPELFYLRRILLHRPVRSFQDALCGFDTFQEAAVSLGYVNLNEMCAIFDELMGLATPRNCRNIFVTLTIEGYPTLKLIKTRRGRFGHIIEDGYDPKYYDAMVDDIKVHHRNCSDSEIFELFLISLDRSFKLRGIY